MILKETTRAGLNAGWVLPPAGIYCPTITFFENESNQDVDLVAQEAHTRFLLSANVHGITVHGTTGEAPMLSHSERNTIVKLVARVRRDMDRLGTTAIVVGCSGQSTREVVAMCEDAAECGGDFVLVLPPSYWSKASTPQVIEDFYTEVADKSPLPVIIYSFPAVCQGVDMDSDLIARLAKHTNIVGVKLTCGNVGKATRLSSMFEPSEFAVFGGSSEWLVPGLIGGTQGAVTGLANTHPRSCVELFQLVREGKLREAVELQGLVSRTEWAMAKTGMAGTKYAVELQKRCGEMGAKVLPRRPLQECSETEKLWIKETMADLTLYEQRLLNSERPKS